MLRLIGALLAALVGIHKDNEMDGLFSRSVDLSSFEQLPAKGSARRKIVRLLKQGQVPPILLFFLVSPSRAHACSLHCLSLPPPFLEDARRFTAQQPTMYTVSHTQPYSCEPQHGMYTCTTCAGVLMDVQKLVVLCKKNLGDLTFQEAFNRTGRIINISRFIDRFAT